MAISKQLHVPVNTAANIIEIIVSIYGNVANYPKHGRKGECNSRLTRQAVGTVDKETEKKKKKTSITIKAKFQGQTC